MVYPTPEEQLHFVGAPNSPFKTRRAGVKHFLNGVAYEIKYHVRVYDKVLIKNKIVEYVLEWTKLFEQLIAELKSQPDVVTSEKSLIKLVVDGGQLNSGIVVSPLAIHDPFTSTLIMERIAACIQSGDKGMTGEDLNMIWVGIWNPIEGKGRLGVVQANAKGRASKKSLWKVETNGRCLSKAVLMGTGRVKYGIPIKNWIANEKNMKLEASSLVLHTAVVGNACSSGGIVHIPIMEDIFDIRICVVSALAGNRFIYKGKEQNAENGTVYLYHSDNHFDVITNVKGFLGVRYFCEHCLKGFRQAGSHSCARYCSLCNRATCKPQPPEKNYSKQCMKCNYVFTTSLSCYLHHKSPRRHNSGTAKSLCERRWQCLICKQTYTGKNKARYAEKHKCYQKFCRFCKRYQDQTHVCYHRSYKPLPSKQKFMFLDFECDVVSTIEQCQEGYCPPTLPDEDCPLCTSYGAICNTCRMCTNCKKRTCGQQLHVPNFCVIQKTCDLCYKNENFADVGCEGCGNRCVTCRPRTKNGEYLKAPCPLHEGRNCSLRETVFSGENITDQVGDYIFQECHKGFKLFAHNMSRYDGCFLMKYALGHGIVPQNIIYRGTKCILWTVPKLNIKVMDTLNFLSMKLEDLPACLGVDIQPKKYFPIWFNDNRQRTYIGPFPPVEAFNLQGMDKDKRADFDTWYSLQKDTIFDLQKTLYEYCSHDVHLLRKCALKFQKTVQEITQQTLCAKNAVTNKEENIIFEGFDPFANSVTLPQMCQKIFRYLFLIEQTSLKVTGEDHWLSAFCKGGKYFCTDENSGETIYFPESCVEKAFFQKSKIGQLHPGGNISRTKYSKISLYFMHYFEKKLHEAGHTEVEIQHGGNGRGEKKIILSGEKKLTSVDGFYKLNGIKYVIEFHGCYHHSCPKCFPTNRQTDYHPFFGVSLEQNYQLTLARDRKIRASGYELITVWECSFREFLTSNSEISQELTNLDLTERLHPRHALFGGRCEAFTLYCHAEQMFYPEGSFIDYYDFVSLYPSVQFAAAFPIGHYTVYTRNFGPLEEYFGLVKARILPPSTNMHIPVLPQRINGRLVFALCKKCATGMVQEACSCTEKERSWIGTYTTVEVLEAVKFGYKVEKIFEIYHYHNTERYIPGEESSLQKGLFSGYIQMFLKLKAEASGWPSYCTTESAKKAFVAEYFDKYGVRLDEKQMIHNKGRRSVSKYCLNTLWGLYCQRPNPQVTTIVGEQELPELIEIMNSSIKTVTNFTVVNDQTLHVEWKYKDEYARANCNRNVILGLFVTSYARIKLNKAMQENPSDVLYCDTDSIFRLNRAGAAPRTNSSLLGELANELKPPEVITEFVSTGSKCYSYATSSGQAVIKAKGFYMTQTLHDKINLKSMLELLDSELEDRGLTASEEENVRIKTEPNCASIDVLTSPRSKRRHIYVARSRIRRNKRKQTITTEPEYKTFSCVFTKRILLADYSTRPYGWRNGAVKGET